MAGALFLIEAPGKRASLGRVLSRLGLHDAQIEATVGHLGANPPGLRPVGINGALAETGYRLQPDKEALAARIAAKAAQAAVVYLATDDDQEGDVIARDALRWCVPLEAHDRVRRLRLRALSQAEVEAALRAATPFEPECAHRGDARRVLDRLVGAMSDHGVAIGRVQGSLLLTLAARPPVVAVVTHLLPAEDAHGPFTAKVEVRGAAQAPTPWAGTAPAAVAHAQAGSVSAAPWNHDEIILASSLRMGASPGAVETALQKLYESGRLTYPRARDRALTSESVRRLGALAKLNGTSFVPRCFSAQRTPGVSHGHEAPNPVGLDVPVNRPLAWMGLEEQVLVNLTQNLIQHGMEAFLERPDLSAVPAGLRELDWQRVRPLGRALWQLPAPAAGVKAWTPAQSVLHCMIEHGLARPSTIVSHVEKFLTRGLVNEVFELTDKGMQWAASNADILKSQNFSAEVEKWIDSTNNPPREMVAGIIKAFGLECLHTRTEADSGASSEYENEAEISPGHVPGSQ